MFDKRHHIGAQIKTLALALAISSPGIAQGENLEDAWQAAFSVNQNLEAARRTTAAAGFDLAAAKAERSPQLFTYNAPSFLTNSVSVASASTSGGATTQQKPSSSQREFVISASGVQMPLYTGGRLRNTIEANKATVNSARADELSTVLDLKLDVARAYVGVLRSNRSLTVARSSVRSLTAQARDTANLVRQGRGIRNDLLAAQVARANAQQREIRAQTELSNAWAAYNRYLGRPLGTVVPLTEMAVEPQLPKQANLPEAIPDEPGELVDVKPVVADEALIQSLIERAVHNRSELSSLVEQARSYDRQAKAERSRTKPQVSFYMTNLYQNAHFLPSQADTGAATFLVNWTFFDGGHARKRSMALVQRGAAQMHQRNELASNIALQVRSSWMTSQETQRRIPVTLAATIQAEENLKVARNRYLEQRGTNTEVIDAENARVQSYDNHYNALYDALLADFQLRRAVGEL